MRVDRGLWRQWVERGGLEVGEYDCSWAVCKALTRKGVRGGGVLVKFRRYGSSLLGRGGVSADSLFNGAVSSSPGSWAGRLYEVGML